MKDIILYSTTLERKFEVEVYESINENDENIFIISHKALQDLFGKLQLEHAVKKDPIMLNYRDVVVLNNHTVIEATITYKGVQFLPQAGESNRETLYGEIANNYPYLTTQRRAFDMILL